MKKNSKKKYFPILLDGVVGDIAMLKLETPFQLSKTVKPIKRLENEYNANKQPLMTFPRDENEKCIAVSSTFAIKMYLFSCNTIFFKI